MNDGSGNVAAYHTASYSKGQRRTKDYISIQLTKWSLNFLGVQQCTINQVYSAPSLCPIVPLPLFRLSRYAQS